MEPEGSLLQLQVPTTCPYPEPARSISLHALNSGARGLTDCLWYVMGHELFCKPCIDSEALCGGGDDDDDEDDVTG
jgi:hypothetical protein